jgi:hypothetical protein
MSGPAALLATLGALYLVECIIAVPGRHVAFRGTARASWRLIEAGLRYGGTGARIALLPLLPWTHGVVLASEDAALLDASAVRARIDAWHDATGALRMDAIGMFALVFGLGPLLVRTLGWQATWPFVAIGVVVIALLIVGDYRAAHAELFPERKGAGFAVLMPIAVSPASAMRAPDVLLRELVVEHHPVAVARVLCHPDEYDRIAGAWLRERRRRDSLGADDADSGHPQRAAIEAFISRTVRDPERLLGPPERRDPDAVSYCPSCLDEYALVDGECADCGGMVLQRFS